ncbi:MAG: ATPase domain-containing protein [Candidatus Altiarchaeota archaeon]
MDDRCPTGIKGFDELIEGGIPRRRTILVNGSCGTGKTTFVTQFIYHGITKNNEPGVMVMLEQDADEYKEDMRSYNFELKKMEDEGKLVIINVDLKKRKNVDFMTLCSDSFTVKQDYETIDKIAELIEAAAEKIGARRVGIDSLSSMIMEFEDDRKLRRLILSLNYRLKQAGLTTLIISDEIGNEVMEAAEKYVVDGVITLRYATAGPDAGRTLVINKMRRTGHSENIHTIKFNKGVGIEVLNE